MLESTADSKENFDYGNARQGNVTGCRKLEISRVMLTLALR
jgi:hypothetical protein